jgi:hypothetical protein
MIDAEPIKRVIRSRKRIVLMNKAKAENRWNAYLIMTGFSFIYIIVFYTVFISLKLQLKIKDHFI